MNCCLREYGIDSIVDIMTHKNKMLLIDGVLSFDLDEYITTFSLIRSDSIFFDDNINGIFSYVGFEYIAQSVAAFSSIESKLSSKTNSNSIGLLLSVANLKCYKPIIECGSLITTTIEKPKNYDNVFYGSGIIRIGNIDIVSARIMTSSVDKSLLE